MEMHQLDGHWYMTSIQGLDGYLRATGIPPSTRGKWMRLLSQTGENGHVEKYTIDLNKKCMRRSTFCNNQLIRCGTVPLGVETFATGYDGNFVKVKMQADGPTKLTRIQHGDNYTVNATAEVSGNTMTSTWQCGGATAVLTFKRLGEVTKLTPC